MPSWTVLIPLVILLAVILVFIAMDAPIVVLPERSFPRVVTSADSSKLAAIVKDKVKYIREHSSLKPYDARAMNLIEDGLNLGAGRLSCAQLALLSTFLMPNAGVGMAPLRALEGEIQSRNNFQFGRGLAGWYFMYGSDDTSCWFLYLARLELCPAALFKDEDVKPGETALYSVACGVSRGGGAWFHCPYTICRGTYSENTDMMFVFQTITNDAGVGDSGVEFYLSCGQGSAPWNFIFEARWATAAGPCAFGGISGPQRPAFWNGRGGCVPCVGGAGTLYWSIPLMKSEYVIVLPDGAQTNHVSTNGWLDRQWISTAVANNGVNMLANIKGTFHNKGRGLGRYLWLNVNAAATVQYAASAFPEGVLTRGDRYKAECTRYDTEGVVWNVRGWIIVNEVVNLDGVVYPSCLTLRVDGRDFVLDCRAYGNCLTIDATNNAHWTGPAVVTEGGRRLAGGFIEANQMQEPRDYVRHMLEASSLAVSDEHIDLFLVKNYSLGQTWTSFILAILVISLPIALAVVVAMMARQR